MAQTSCLIIIEGVPASTAVVIKLLMLLLVMMVLALEQVKFKRRRHVCCCSHLQRLTKFVRNYAVVLLSVR